MQLQELNEKWKRLDLKLDQTLAMGNELMRQVVMQPARRRINRLAIWPALDIVFTGSVLLLGGTFLGGHGQDWKLAAPTLVVMLSAAALLANSIRQLQLGAQLDWTAPVVNIQTALEQLQVMKVQQFKWIMLLSPLVGFCAFIVGLHWLFEWLTVDRVQILGHLHPWIVANYAFGVLFVPLGYFLARILANRYHRYRWWQSVLDGISGTSLNAARQDVERWASLQRTPGNPS